MKLHELDAQRQTEQVAKTLRTHLGSQLSFDRLSESQTSGMLKRVRGLLKEYKTSVSRHYSERNPDYLKLMMMEQALSARISEMGETPVAVDVNDPKTKAVLDKAAKGMNLSPDEQKTVSAVAIMKKEAARQKKMVAESEIQQAQVVMAAQDMVDQIQKMMEQISAMQFKDLPALTDAIKNDMGVEQATQFQQQAAAALTNLLTAVQGSKTEMENAQGVLTGQAPQVPGTTDAMASPEPAEPGADVDLDLDANLPAEEEPEDLAPAASLGRERR